MRVLTQTFIIIRRVYFTLVELLVVMAILLLIGSFIAINIKKALLDQKFRTEINLIVDQIKLAQDLMLILQQDVHLIFTSDGKGGINYKIKCDNPLPANWSREIQRFHKTLRYVHRVDFDDQLKIYPIKQGEIDLKFMSKGTILSKGILVLSGYSEPGTEGPLNRYVCLPGYPTPVHSTSKIPNSLECGLEPTPYDEELTNNTIREVELHMPHKKENQQSLDEKPNNKN